MAGTESDGLFGRVSGADVRLAPFYSPASIGLRTFGVLRPMLAGLFGALTAARQYLILPLTCIGARCRDSAQRPCFAEFRHACAAQQPRHAGTHGMRLGPCGPAAQLPRFSPARASQARALRERGIGEQRGRDRWYFRCRYAEQHKPALAGEPIKSSQANAGGRMCLAGAARAQQRSKTLYLLSAFMACVCEGDAAT